MRRLCKSVVVLVACLVLAAGAGASTDSRAPCDLVQALVRLDAASGSAAPTPAYGRDLAGAVQRHGQALDLTENQIARWSEHLENGAAGKRPWSRLSLLNMAAVCDAAQMPTARSGGLSDLKLGAGAYGTRHQRFPQLDREPAKRPGRAAAWPPLRVVLAFLLAFTSLSGGFLYHFRRARLRERREKRHFCNVPVQLVSRSLHRMPATMVDCSMSGCMLTQGHPRMEKGTHLHLDTPVGLVAGRVMWANTYYFGVRFSKSLQEIQVSLLIMRSRHGQKEPEPHGVSGLHIAHAGLSGNRAL